MHKLSILNRHKKLTSAEKTLFRAIEKNYITSKMYKNNACIEQ